MDTLHAWWNVARPFLLQPGNEARHNLVPHWGHVIGHRGRIEPSQSPPFHFNSDCSIALLWVLCMVILFEWLLLHFSSRTDSKQLLPQAGKPYSHNWKIVSITCTNLILTGWMRYCNYRDTTSVYSLNSWTLPGELSQVQTVTSTARKLAVPIKFQNIVTWQQ